MLKTVSARCSRITKINFDPLQDYQTKVVMPHLLERCPSLAEISSLSCWDIAWVSQPLISLTRARTVTCTGRETLDVLRAFAQNCPSLESVYFWGGYTLVEPFECIFEHWPSLTELTIKMPEHNCLKSLRLLPKLTDLDLRFFAGVMQLSDLRLLCESAPNLTAFSSDKCFSVQELGVLSSLSDLKCLKTGFDFNTEIVVEFFRNSSVFPKLQTLRFFMSTDIEYDTRRELSRDLHDTLASLRDWIVELFSTNFVLF